MLYAVDVLTRGALLLDGTLRAEQPQLRLALFLRLAPPQHVEGEPRILLGALERTRAEHTFEVCVGLVEFSSERRESLVAVAASAQPPAERFPLHARGLRAVTQWGADTTRADDGRGDLRSEGKRARHQDTSTRTCAAMERIRSGGTLLPMRSKALDHESHRIAVGNDAIEADS